MQEDMYLQDIRQYKPTFEKMLVNYPIGNRKLKPTDIEYITRSMRLLAVNDSPTFQI